MVALRAMLLLLAAAATWPAGEAHAAGASNIPDYIGTLQHRVDSGEFPNLHSVIIEQRGTILFERYLQGSDERRGQPLGTVQFERDTLHDVRSVSKSIVSTLVGIAIDRRILEGVRQPIVRFFPDLTKDPDPRKARISVEDLLTMRSGLESTSFDNYGTWVRSRNWVAHVLNQALVSEPGNSFEYSTGSTHLLSAFLTKASKKSTWALLQESLGKPLGFTFSGASGFLMSMEPPPGMAESAVKFTEVLSTSHYMYVVKVLELTGDPQNPAWLAQASA